jgi:hypothetical protein
LHVKTFLQVKNLLQVKISIADQKIFAGQISFLQVATLFSG